MGLIFEWEDFIMIKGIFDLTFNKELLNGKRG